MNTNFVDATLAQIEHALEHYENNDYGYEFADCVLKDAKICLTELREELKTKCDAKFIPGQIAYFIVGDKIREGSCICSGYLYDEKHTEPLNYAAFMVNIDGVKVKMKWMSDGRYKMPHKTKEEAEDELRRESTGI